MTVKPRGARGDTDRGGQALPILKLGCPLLLSLKILCSGALLNPTTFQNAFCSLVTTCFTHKPKPSCPFCAEGLLPHPRRGKRQHTLAVPGPSASFLLTWPACSPTPGSPPPTPFPLSLQQLGLCQAKTKSWTPLGLI